MNLLYFVPWIILTHYVEEACFCPRQASYLSIDRILSRLVVIWYLAKIAHKHHHECVWKSLCSSQVLQCLAKKLDFFGFFIQNANTRKGRKLLKCYDKCTNFCSILSINIKQNFISFGTKIPNIFGNTSHQSWEYKFPY